MPEDVGPIGGRTAPLLVAMSHVGRITSGGMTRNHSRPRNASGTSATAATGDGGRRRVRRGPSSAQCKHCDSPEAGVHNIIVIIIAFL